MEILVIISIIVLISLIVYCAIEEKINNLIITLISLILGFIFLVAPSAYMYANENKYYVNHEIITTELKIGKSIITSDSPVKYKITKTMYPYFLHSTTKYHIIQ